MCVLGVEVGQEQQFLVNTKGAGGQGRLEVEVVSVNRFMVCRRSPPALLQLSCIIFSHLFESIDSTKSVGIYLYLFLSLSTFSKSLSSILHKVMFCFCGCLAESEPAMCAMQSGATAR